MGSPCCCCFGQLVELLTDCLLLGVIGFGDLPEIRVVKWRSYGAQSANYLYIANLQVLWLADGLDCKDDCGQVTISVTATPNCLECLMIYSGQEISMKA